MSLVADTGDIWTSAGLIAAPAKMVTTPPIGVYLYQPTNLYAGFFYMRGYEASNIVQDLLQTREGGVTMLHNEPAFSIMVCELNSISKFTTTVSYMLLLCFFRLLTSRQILV
jgi:hypothetical protein